MEDLIYCQRDIPKDQWRYGLRASAATGCGWIATYNALRLMNYRAAPEELIRYYERQFPLVHGNAGTSIPGPALFFIHHGFSVKMVSDRSRFEELVKQSDECIVFYYWRKEYKFGAHFVTVTHADGKFTGYNTYRNSEGPDDYGDSLDEFLKKRKYFGCVLIAIQNKKKEG
jgi:hypothetical protein